MAKYTINKGSQRAVSVEASWYRQEAEFFVFYAGGSELENKVLTFAAGETRSITKESESK